MPDSLTMVVCPQCMGDLTQGEAGLHCPACNADYATSDGILYLMKSGTTDTLLKVESYAKIATASPESLENTYRQFQNAAGADRPLTGAMLEIGTGTGLLTEAMLRHATFDTVISTDVSVDFLKHTGERLSASFPNLTLVACDGNVLPMRKGCFDAVLGRSVLHHLLNYRQALQQVHGLLKPGGIAVFHEPVQQGKSVIAFLFRIILEIDEMTGAIGLTPKERGIMTRAQKKMLKSVTVEQTEEVLSQMEDKYIFDVDILADEAREMGFVPRFVNDPNMDYSYFSYLRQHLRSRGIRPEVVDKVSWLKEAFGDTIGAVAQRRLTSPMGYFVFEKPV